MLYALVTTKDNPFDPFDDFDNWNAFDIQHGYNTMSYLDRVARISDDLGDEAVLRQIEDAVDEIVYFNLTGNYVKVTREVDSITE